MVRKHDCKQHTPGFRFKFSVAVELKRPTKKKKSGPNAAFSGRKHFSEQINGHHRVSALAAVNLFLITEVYYKMRLFSGNIEATLSVRIYHFNC